MRRGGNANVTVRIFDNLSHMLVPDPEGLASGWKQLPSYRMSDELLHTLTDWLVRQLRPSRSEPHGGAAPVHHDAP
jgi:hypothetical protein